MSRQPKLPRFLRVARVRVRRSLHRLDQKLPAWTQQLTPWGSSLSLHVVVLTLLAVLFFRSKDDDGTWGTNPLNAEFADQLLDDLTTLEDADEAGDPFTRMQDDFASMPMELDPELLNVPDLPDTIAFADRIDLQPIEPTMASPDLFAGSGVGPARMGAETITAPFSGRQAAMKAQLLRTQGGSKESEAAVERGLDWLARHQAPNGSWSLDPTPHCDLVGCPPDPASTSDTAATGLALLPLLGAGHSHTEVGRYQATIERGLNWLLQVQQPSGELFIGGGGTARLYSHAIAAMALCEAYGISKDPRLKAPAQKATEFIILSQSAMDGGWRYQPGQPGDTSVFGWQLMALRSAHLAGLKIPGRTLQAAKRYLDLAAADPTKATYSYRPGRSASPVMTAEALLCRQYFGAKRTAPPLQKGAAWVAKDSLNSSERNIYYWYYAAQLLHNMGGETWVQWNQAARDHLVATQVTTHSCDYGSWSALEPQADRWGRNAGRHYVTCLSLLTLEVYYRYLPLYRERDLNPITGSTEAAE